MYQIRQGVFETNSSSTHYKDWGTGFERFESHFTTPSGDKMVAFGEFGYDG